jgi:hypothetical protein
VFSNLLELPGAVNAGEGEEVHVVLEEGGAVRDGDEGWVQGKRSAIGEVEEEEERELTDASVFRCLIHRAFDIGRDGTARLIEDGVFREVVEKTSHRHLRDKQVSTLRTRTKEENRLTRCFSPPESKSFHSFRASNPEKRKVSQPRQAKSEEI